MLNPGAFSDRENQIPLGVARYRSGQCRSARPCGVSPPDDALACAGAAAQLTDRARETAIEILERLQPDGGCEFVSAFAGVMPIVAFLTLVNLPIEEFQLGW